MKRNQMPECFASQGRSLLGGEMPTQCLDCDVFEQCHKITVAASLQSISDALDLIVQNGLTDGRLKGFQELETLWDAEPEKKPEPNCEQAVGGDSVKAADGLH